MPYEPVPTMPEQRLAPLIEAFARAVSGTTGFSGMFTAAG